MNGLRPRQRKVRSTAESRHPFAPGKCPLRSGLTAERKDYRNLPKGDIRALAQAVAAMSRLALAPGRPVAEAECNPVIVKAQGAVAVDALLVMKE